MLLTVFIMGISHENDKKARERKVQGKEMNVTGPDERLTATGRGREVLTRTRGTRPRNDMGCTSIGGICQHNTYICQGRYLKDKCRGEISRQCCTPGLILHYEILDLTKCL